MLLYERWPYPDVPLIADVPPLGLWQLHLDWMRSRAGLGPVEGAGAIWIAGCGSFQPLVWRRANPRADILAGDLSTKSLQVAERRLLLHAPGGRFVGDGATDFQQMDLESEADLPPEGGQFDHIECFGVLMNLRDPGLAVGRMARRLRRDGTMRLMVYPRFGRQRVNRILRIGRLAGLSWERPGDPARLRRLMGSLAPDHPLRATFEDYVDARTDAGLVDGFLHPSDQTFDSYALLRMAAAAGLEPVFCYHRPWGDPWRMARLLEPGLGARLDAAAALQYLDLWQELKSNLIVLFRKTDRQDGQDGQAPPPLPAPRLHPFLSRDSPLGWRARLSAQAGRLWGLGLEDRCGADRAMTLTGAELRDLDRRAAAPDGLRGIAHPMVLWGADSAGAPTDAAADRSAWRDIGGAAMSELSRAPICAGERVINPLYAHHLSAFRLLPTLGLRLDADQQAAAWEAHIRPMEDGDVPFGFSPWATWRRHPSEIGMWAERLGGAQRAAAWEGEVGGWGDVRLPEEAARMRELRGLLERAGLEEAPGRLEATGGGAARELWMLLLGYKDMFMRIDA